MKRSGRIARKTEIKRGGKPLRKCNPEATAKRRLRQASKHRAYMRSETRKVVDARAEGRCEAWVVVQSDTGSFRIFAAIRTRHDWGERTDFPMPVVINSPGGTAGRCENAAKAHHHLTYARYGGDELPSDVLKVCKRCHESLEAEHPTRNRRYSHRRLEA